MLSRVAESIYWMGRQVERAENLARFLEVTHNLILDQPEDLVDPWWPLVQITGETEWFFEHYPAANALTVTKFLAFDLDYPNSMLSSLQMARTNARSVREMLSSEAFEQVNQFYHFVADSAQDAKSLAMGDYLDAVRRHAISWSGVLDSTMPRDTVWHFVNVGRLIERADKTTRILDVKYFNILPQLDDIGTAVDDLQWSALLMAVSGIEAYRRQYHWIQISSLIEFFLFDPNFPRSLRCCLEWMADSLEMIQELTPDAEHHESLDRTRKLLHVLESTTVDNVLSMGMHEFVDSIQC